jgi:hypothetical protein
MAGKRGGRSTSAGASDLSPETVRGSFLRDHRLGVSLGGDELWSVERMTVICKAMKLRAGLRCCASYVGKSASGLCSL